DPGARLPALDHLPALDPGRVLFRLAVPGRRLAGAAPPPAGHGYADRQLHPAGLFRQRDRHRAGPRPRLVRRGGDVRVPPARGAGGRGSGPWAAREAAAGAGVAVGEVVPADWRLLEPARLEEALLRGESTPVDREAGDIAYAGTVCRERPTRLQVVATGAGTRLAELSHLVEQAQSQRPALAQTAGRIAHHFVAGLLVATVLVYLGWRIHDPSRAFEVTLALLVISCPCALSLAVPSALTSAHGALARLGVLAVRGNAME